MERRELREIKMFKATRAGSFLDKRMKRQSELIMTRDKWKHSVLRQKGVLCVSIME